MGAEREAGEGLTRMLLAGASGVDGTESGDAEGMMHIGCSGNDVGDGGMEALGEGLKGAKEVEVRLWYCVLMIAGISAWSLDAMGACFCCG